MIMLMMRTRMMTVKRRIRSRMVVVTVGRGGFYIFYILYIMTVLHSSYLKAPPNVPLSHLCSAFFEGRPSLCFQLFFVSALALGSLQALLDWMAKFKFIPGASRLKKQTFNNGPGWPEVIVFPLGACRPLFKSEIS